MRKPVRRVFTLTKMTALDGTLLGYRMPAGRRIGNHDTEFVDKDAVPPFDGDSAEFEMERVPATPWPRWVAVRRL